MNARDYLMLPWSIRGPLRVTDEHGGTHHEMRVAQLPDFLVAASSESEVLNEFKPALLAFLESYTSEGEVPPLPPGQPAEYVAPYSGRRQLHARVRVPSEDTTTGSPPVREALV
jgi:hypothetical protein